MTKDQKRRLYRDHNLAEGFGSFEAWSEWVDNSDHNPFYHLKKRDKTKPHSPDNSYFCERKPAYLQDGKNRGESWKEKFIRDWNERIYRPDPELQAKEPAKNVWQYEHPDLVREGIVWTGEQK